MATRGCVERATPVKIMAVERQRQALELRKAGWTFQAIANEVGYANRSSAADAITTALRATVQEAADDLRKLECERLDSLLSAMWPKGVGGNHLAVDRCLAIMERRARLLGLDAPLRLRQEVITADDIDRAIREMNEKADALEAEELVIDTQAKERCLGSEPTESPGSGV
jgi:hypothetical protein